ncbi:MAG: ATP-dependent sacrificial sulfur transferase LarE [Eubacteriales bacterium]
MAETKLELLRNILVDMESVLIAYSGGIDSTLLLKVALESLGPQKVLAVTAASETYPSEEWESAKRLADTIGANHLSIFTEELKNEDFFQNPPERCYHCKKELFGKLYDLAGKNNLAFVADGANADDLNDFRPGMRAGKELGVRSPLQEAGLSKEEIRSLARDQGLPNWNKPSMPCLSSRFPYGHTITSEKLRQVEEAERYIRSLGLNECRVRHHGDTARIEVPDSFIEMAASRPFRQQVTAKLNSLGFNYITLDLRGFRSGSMNEVLSKEELNG